MAVKFYRMMIRVIHVMNVIIENNVWIGDDVLILGECRIGEGAIIQGGSVVCKNASPLGIAGVHPATVFKYRDKEHYYSLKYKK